MDNPNNSNATPAVREPSADELRAMIERSAPGGGALAMPEPDEYTGIAAAPFTEEQRRVLERPAGDSELDIRPDGLVYLPGVQYRLRLNEAFGAGAWALRPAGEWYNADDNHLYYRGHLFVLGRFIAASVGGAEYHPDNGRQAYDDALESAKTNCLMRCCKDLCIAAELWKPGVANRWRDRHAVEVWCRWVGTGNRGNRPEKKRLWRLKSSPPIDAWPYREEAPGYGDTKPSNSQEIDARTGRPRKGPQSDFSPGGVNIPTPGDKNPVAGAQGAKNGMPPRPWSPAVLSRALQVRAKTLDEAFVGREFRDAAERDSERDEVLAHAENVLAVLVGDGGDALLEATAKYVFGVPDVLEGGLTYGQALAVVQWCRGAGAPGSVDTMAAAEFALLKVELATSGEYAGLNPG